MTCKHCGAPIERWMSKCQYCDCGIDQWDIRCPDEYEEVTLYADNRPVESVMQLDILRRQTAMLKAYLAMAKMGLMSMTDVGEKWKLERLREACQAPLPAWK